MRVILELQSEVIEMKKLTSAVFGAFAIASVAAPVHADSGNMYYNDGATLDFGDNTLKINGLVQARYSFIDIDNENRRNNGFEESQDTSGFEVNRATIYLTGKLMNGAFDFALNSNFAADSGSSDLEDAYLQWNVSDHASIRMGQFKQPYNREFGVNDHTAYFTNLSVVTDILGLPRYQGAMVHGEASDMFHWYAAINNGESTGEGTNLGPVDNKMQGLVGLEVYSDNFGSRAVEGDFRDDDSFGWTAAVYGAYGEGTEETLGKFEKLDINADVGIRVSGFELYGEFFYSTTDLEIAIDGEDSPRDIGWFVSGMYNINENIGAGVRYAMLDPEFGNADLVGADDVNELTLALNYFFSGHNLKIQNGLTWRNTGFEGGGDDIDDLRYDLLVSGYF